MKTILIPTDFSDTARNALQFAVNLFGKDNKFIMMNSYIEPSTATSSMISLRDVLAESSEDGLKEELAHFETELGLTGLDLSTRSVYGEAPQAISNTAKIEEADVIVMGTTGASGVKEVFIGSVAAATLQRTHCPVITVPSRYEYKAPTNILFASDLKAFENEELPAIFMDLVESSNANVTVLTVQKGGKAINNDEAEHGYEIHVQLQKIQHEFEVIDSEDVEAGIINYAHENNVDMIVTVPRKSSWFNRLFNPSVSKKLVQHIDIPMLALNT